MAHLGSGTHLLFICLVEFYKVLIATHQLQHVPHEVKSSQWMRLRPMHLCICIAMSILSKVSLSLVNNGGIVWPWMFSLAGAKFERSTRTSRRFESDFFLLLSKWPIFMYFHMKGHLIRWQVWQCFIRLLFLRYDDSASTDSYMP